MSEDSSHGCASIEKFSYYKDEEEVLVFPFSCFEIKDIKKIQENDYKIYLGYLGKYKSFFEGKNLDELFREVPKDSYFTKEIFKSNIIDNKYIK